MLIGDHEDCLECSGIKIAVLWLELVILVRKPVGSQIVSTKSRWLSTVYFHPLYRGTWYLTGKGEDTSNISMSWFPSAISRYLVSDLNTPAKCRACPATVSIRYIAVLGI